MNSSAPLPRAPGDHHRREWRRGLPGHHRPQGRRQRLHLGRQGLDRRRELWPRPAPFTISVAGTDTSGEAVSITTEVKGKGAGGRHLRAAALHQGQRPPVAAVGADRNLGLKPRTTLPRPSRHLRGRRAAGGAAAVRARCAGDHRCVVLRNEPMVTRRRLFSADNAVPAGSLRPPVGL